jgi:hypothetical protein
MTNYEAIGRYHAAVKRVQELIAKQNNSLTRTSALINNVAQYKPYNTHIIGKRCNFEASQN